MFSLTRQHLDGCLEVPFLNNMGNNRNSSDPLRVKTLFRIHTGTQTERLLQFPLARYEVTLHEIQMKEKLPSLQVNLNKYSVCFSEPNTTGSDTIV